MAVSIIQYALSGANAFGDYAAKGMTQYAPPASKSGGNSIFNALIVETILIIIGFMVISSAIKRSF